MKRLIGCLLCAGLTVFCWCAELRAQNGAATDNRPVLEHQVSGGLATLYALDPLSRAICFHDGREGFAIQKNRWTSRCSDLGFTVAGDGSFVAGIEAKQVAAIVDLGTPDDLRQRYGYEDAENGGEGFASLRLRGNRIVILKEDNPNEKLQSLKEAPALFTDTRPSATAPIKLGHIYLIRIANRQNSDDAQIIKLIVIAYKPNESVTLRWERL